MTNINTTVIEEMCHDKSNTYFFPSIVAQIDVAEFLFSGLLISLSRKLKVVFVKWIIPYAPYANKTGALIMEILSRNKWDYPIQPSFLFSMPQMSKSLAVNIETIP